MLNDLFLGVNVLLSWSPCFFVFFLLLLFLVLFFCFFYFTFRPEKAALKTINQVKTIENSLNKKLDSILFPIYLVLISTCIACVQLNARQKDKYVNSNWKVACCSNILSIKAG